MNSFWTFSKGPMLYKNISHRNKRAYTHPKHANKGTREENGLASGICFAAYFCFLSANIVLWFAK